MCCCLAILISTVCVVLLTTYLSTFEGHLLRAIDDPAPQDPTLTFDEATLT